MGNSKYSLWISDEQFEDLICDVYKSYSKAVAKKVSLLGLEEKLIDPFEFALISHTTQDNIAVWLRNEFNRQTQKTLTNALGGFHQKLLGTAPNWKDLKRTDKSGLDLFGKVGNDDIYAEVKNKFNTMNSGSAQTVFNKLKKTIDEYGASKAYLVQILPKNGMTYDELWLYTPKGGYANSDDRIRIISGDKFYSMVTGQKDALSLVQMALPKAILSILNDQNRNPLHNQNPSQLESELKLKIKYENLEFQNAFPLVYTYFYNAAYQGTKPSVDDIALLVEPDDAQENSE